MRDNQTFLPFVGFHHIAHARGLGSYGHGERKAPHRIDVAVGVFFAFLEAKLQGY
jgi:hypothetical protein